MKYYKIISIALIILSVYALAETIAQTSIGDNPKRKELPEQDGADKYAYIQVETINNPQSIREDPIVVSMKNINMKDLGCQLYWYNCDRQKRLRIPITEYVRVLVNIFPIIPQPDSNVPVPKNIMFYRSCVEIPFVMPEFIGEPVMLGVLRVMPIEKVKYHQTDKGYSLSWNGNTSAKRYVIGMSYYLGNGGSTPGILSVATDDMKIDLDKTSLRKLFENYETAIRRRWPGSDNEDDKPKDVIFSVTGYDENNLEVYYGITEWFKMTIK